VRIATLVNNYARRFCTVHGSGHSIASALGAWLVLALVAPAANGELREQLVDLLGCDAETAVAAAEALGKDPHPAVRAALAAWTADGYPGLERWRTGLPSAVTTGPIPMQADADAWVREHSLELIDSFPFDLDSASVALVASVLATKVSWLRPFDLVDASQLGGWSDEQLSTALLADGIDGHGSFIADTDRAGTVGVHSAWADGDLRVLSVIAETAVARADVLAAAHDLAYGQLSGSGSVSPRSLFDLPLGDSPIWTITEEHSEHAGEHVRSILPAWRADTRHDLLADPQLGFRIAAAALQRRAGVGGPVDAVQHAVARYDRHGFEAAALTSLAVAASFHMPPAAGPYRIATIRFNHPYAVVASTLAPPDSPWQAMPVFSAWVAEPENPSDDE
jgi:hypothetical protein